MGSAIRLAAPTRRAARDRAALSFPSACERRRLCRRFDPPSRPSCALQHAHHRRSTLPPVITAHLQTCTVERRVARQAPHASRGQAKLCHGARPPAHAHHDPLKVLSAAWRSLPTRRTRRPSATEGMGRASLVIPQAAPARLPTTCTPPRAPVDARPAPSLRGPRPPRGPPPVSKAELAGDAPCPRSRRPRRRRGSAPFRRRARADRGSQNSAPAERSLRHSDGCDTPPRALVGLMTAGTPTLCPRHPRPVFCSSDRAPARHAPPADRSSSSHLE